MEHGGPAKIHKNETETYERGIGHLPAKYCCLIMEILENINRSAAPLESDAKSCVEEFSDIYKKDETQNGCLTSCLIQIIIFHN